MRKLTQIEMNRLLNLVYYSEDRELANHAQTLIRASSWHSIFYIEIFLKLNNLNTNFQLAEYIKLTKQKIELDILLKIRAYVSALSDETKNLVLKQLNEYKKSNIGILDLLNKTIELSIEYTAVNQELSFFQSEVNQAINSLVRTSYYLEFRDTTNRCARASKL